MPPGSIFENFIHCMRTRDPQQLHADILEAHYSAAFCHLGNIAYRLGSKCPATTAPTGFPDNPQVNESLGRLESQLEDALGLKWADTTYQQGAVLEFDPQTERFVDNDRANQLITRDYREPFVVREVT